MAREKFLIVGSGGREGAFAMRLMEDARLYAVMGHENPLIADCVKRSGGQYMVGEQDDPATVLGFANEHAMDYAFVNADRPLANGVVDALLYNGIKAVGGTREAARIEWDKAYALDLMRLVCPESTPFYRVVADDDALMKAMFEFKTRGFGVVVKPQGLTGGKGVKVMRDHLPTYRDCAKYASSLLDARRGEKVVLVEKIKGIEFTVMGITDGTGLAMAPASYDYPFRYAGNAGAGTGGMGCFTDAGMGLPFLRNGDLEDCRSMMQSVLDKMRSMGLNFTGVLNGGFFKTHDGIKFMEWNARFGDPEAINILSVLDGSFAELLRRIWNGDISQDAVSFAKRASVVKYLVAREYPEASPAAAVFRIDEGAMAGLGITTYHAACTRMAPGMYRTMKRSRAVAFGATADTITEAADAVNKAINLHVSGGLEYRHDIGTGEDLGRLVGMAARMP